MRAHLERTWSVPGQAPSIAAGIDSAAAGDTVLVACGTYAERGLAVKSGVTLRSATGVPGCVRLEGGCLGRLLLCVGTQAGTRIEGFTLADGSADSSGTGLERSGGAVRCDSASVAITDCFFTRNTAKFAGALACRVSSLTRMRCEFDTNTASASDWAAGGAIYSLSSSPALTQCVFSENTASSIALPGDGGAVFSVDSDLHASECTFTGNSGGAGGGAFYSFAGDRSSLERSTFTDNHSEAGGAVYVEGSSPSFTECLFTGNGAANGGAVFMGESSAPQFTDCRFDSNSASPFSGGAVDCWQSSPLFPRCELAHNSAALRGGAASANGASSLSFTDWLFEANSAGGNGGALRLAGSATASLGGCDVLANAGAGSGGGIFLEDLSAVTAERTLIAFSAAGEAIACSGNAAASLVCSDIFGNAGRDWVGCVAPQAGSAGNLAEDPLFCDGAAGDYSRRLPESPCLPQNNPCAERIGRLGAGCSCPASATLLVPSEYPTIGAALAAAVPGDVVGVYDGVYSETIRILPGVHLLGAGQDLCRLEWPGGSEEAVIVARGVSDSTVVEGFTFDGLGVATQVVLAESSSTGVHLRSNRIRGAASWGIRNAADSRISIGGALAWANDILENRLLHLLNENTISDSLEATCNWWGTTRYDSILAMIEGPVRSCPITDAAHSASLCGPLSAIGAPQPTGARTAELELTTNPNPSGGSTEIFLHLPAAGRVRLAVYDIAGRRIRTLLEGPLPAGAHAVLWRGHNERGRTTGAGVYFVRLETPGRALTRKIVRLR